MEFILFCNLRIWEHISEQWVIFVSYSTVIGKLFSTIKLVMRISSLEILSQWIGLWNNRNSRFMSQWRRFVFMCISQYVSLYISFILMSTTKFPRTNHTYKVCLRAWSLNWLFPYWANQLCLSNFIIFTEIFKSVDFCVSLTIIGVSVRAWYDALKRDSHRYGLISLHGFISVLWCPLRFPRKHDVRFVFIPICYPYWCLTDVHDRWCSCRLTGTAYPSGAPEFTSGF
jgi:hypothetical protein